MCCESLECARAKSGRAVLASQPMHPMPVWMSWMSDLEVRRDDSPSPSIEAVIGTEAGVKGPKCFSMMSIKSVQYFSMSNEMCVCEHAMLIPRKSMGESADRMLSVRAGKTLFRRS